MTQQLNKYLRPGVIEDGEIIPGTEMSSTFVLTVR